MKLKERLEKIRKSPEYKAEAEKIEAEERKLIWEHKTRREGYPHEK